MLQNTENIYPWNYKSVYSFTVYYLLILKYLLMKNSYFWQSSVFYILKNKLLYGILHIFSPLQFWACYQLANY